MVLGAWRALWFRGWALLTALRLRRLGGRLVLEVAAPPRLRGPLRVEIDGRPGTLTLRLGRDVKIGRDCVLDLADGRDGTVELADRVTLQSRVRLQPWGGAIRIGAGTQIRDGCELKSKGELRLGGRSVFARHTTVHCDTAITVGDCAAVAERVTIMDSDHTTDGSDTFVLDQPVRAEPVVVGRNVLCGTNAVVLRGARIGSNSVVAAGAVVTGGEHPAGWLLGGIPARPLKALPDGAYAARE